MKIKEAIEYWEVFNSEIDDLYNTCSDEERSILEKQRDVVEFTISALRELVARRKQKCLGKWISVKDRLPESHDGRVQCIVCVLCSYSNSYGEYGNEKFVMPARYDSNQKIWHLDFEEWKDQLNALIDIDDAPEEGNYITHWMPLPEPPKEEAK